MPSRSRRAAGRAAGQRRVVGDDDQRRAVSRWAPAEQVDDRLRVASSSEPVGSSARITRGRLISARATATRWRCPPESWSGSLPACSPRPSRASSSAGAIAVVRPIHVSASWSSTFSSAVRNGRRLSAWKTSPTSPRADARPRRAPAGSRSRGRRARRCPAEGRLEPRDQAQQRRLAAAARARDGEAACRARSRA